MKAYALTILAHGLNKTKGSPSSRSRFEIENKVVAHQVDNMMNRLTNFRPVSTDCIPPSESGLVKKLALVEDAVRREYQGPVVGLETIDESARRSSALILIISVDKSLFSLGITPTSQYERC